MADDPKPKETDPVKARINDVLDDLSARRVSDSDRRRLGDGLDRANKPRTGKDGADDAFGRIVPKRGW